MIRADLLVSIIIAALGSPLLLALVRAARDAWRQRRDVETESQRWRREAAAWETACWATRTVAVRLGADPATLPRGPGEDAGDDR